MSVLVLASFLVRGLASWCCIVGRHWSVGASAIGCLLKERPPLYAQALAGWLAGVTRISVMQTDKGKLLAQRNDCRGHDAFSLTDQLLSLSSTPDAPSKRSQGPIAPRGIAPSKVNHPT
jgi:hypothetical protein